MDFDELLAQILHLLQRDKRLSYRALKRRFALDDEYLEDVKAELIQAKQLDVCFVNPLPVSCSSAPVYNGSHAHIVVDTSPVFIRSGTMPVPLAPHVTLASDEQSRLEAIARAPSTPQALAFRCQVILRTAAPEHPSNLEVAQALHCNRHTVGRWRSRYLAQGLCGLQDAPRPGRPRRFSPRSPARSDGDGHP